MAQDALREKKVKSFQSNRFRRIGELSEAITEQKILIEAFLDEQVNENQNKLVLAVAAYIQSDWFLLCAKVATFFYEIVRIKLKKSNGLDEFKKQKKMKTEVEPDSHNWSSMKSCLEGIINDLNDLGKSTVNPETTDEEVLKDKCSVEVKVAIERQMSRDNYVTGRTKD